MQKPNNYENTQEQGAFEAVELGGHYMVIKQVNETKSKKGKDMIVVLFDFDQSDKQPGYFMEQFKNDIRPDKKYPNQATQYILSEDMDGNCSRSFKTFIGCVERSNAGFSVQWGENFCQQFKGKKIGGVFGEQMDFYNGEEKKKRVLRWFCQTDKVSEASIPEISETKAYKEHKMASPEGSVATSPDGFMNIPDGLDEELPFN